MIDETLDSKRLGELLGLLRERSGDFACLMSYYRCAMMEVETKFNVLNEEYSLLHDRNPIVAVRSRLKTPASIREKAERRGIPLQTEALERELPDIAGVRVICSFPDDVYSLADTFLAQDDIHLISRKDYIARPKANGYRSLHLLVSIPIYLAREKREMKVEVQLRTLAMDLWASLEHQIRYKKGLAFSESAERELRECAEMSAELDARMDCLRRLAAEQLQNGEKR